MSSHRVSGAGRVNLRKPLHFTFNGAGYVGYHGDTLASALLANGVHFVARSFKYHRPRGILSAGSEEPNALVSVRRGGGRFSPNTRATTLELYDGLNVVSQNHWPSLRYDAAVINDAVPALLSAGFYYKTFKWPKSFWDKIYEPAIRRAAGLGQPPREPDPDSYAHRFSHCDILIVGAGPAGLAAALESGKSGAKVILVDEQAEIGGSLLSELNAKINGRSGWDWIADVIAQLTEMPNVQLLPRTTAIGYYNQNLIGLCQRLTDHLPSSAPCAPRERLWKVRARQVVLAQGAIEKPLVFNGNDRPGVMLASAARTYLNRYGVRVGRRIVVVTSHDLAWVAAFDFANAGANVSAIIDLRAKISDALVDRARELGIELLAGWAVTGTSGRTRIRSVRAKDLHDSTPGRTLKCDALLISGGWTPSVHLFSHSRGKLVWQEQEQIFLPGERAEDCRCAGAGNGNFDLFGALIEGATAGASAARDAGFAAQASNYTVENVGPNAALSLGRPAETGTRIRAGVNFHKDATATQANEVGSRGRAFVDFQNDVTAQDIRLAVTEGFKSIEHIKRYTTNGMATDQGKTSNINGLAIASGAIGRPVPEVGLTTFRPPFTPTTFGAFAGYSRGILFDPTRRTPIDSWAEENDAVFEPVSLWRRARYFPHSGEDIDQAVRRECRAVRQSLGMFDASTLGKIEIVGPDAAEFLNRMYTNSWNKLIPGRCRYGVLLGEDGFIRDDGVIGRLTSDRFHATTTTGGAARAVAMMEDYLQTEWPELRVWLTPTTEQWAVIALNGPNVRRLLVPLVEDIDISAGTFPHMSVAECKVCGFPARLFRVSFTGELGFEVNVPARHGRTVWEILYEAGQQYGIKVYGTEAMHVLRAEKGYIIVGQDTDGTLTPDDAGLAWTIGKTKADFVGKRSLVRPDMLKPDRKQLVGLLTSDPNIVLTEGAQIVAHREVSGAMKSIGHVTSAYWSETLGRSIALAVVEGGRSKKCQTVYVPMMDQMHSAEVVGTVFVDPEGTHLEA